MNATIEQATETEIATANIRERQEKENWSPHQLARNKDNCKVLIVRAIIAYKQEMEETFDTKFPATGKDAFWGADTTDIIKWFKDNNKNGVKDSTIKSTISSLVSSGFLVKNKADDFNTWYYKLAVDF